MKWHLSAAELEAAGGSKGVCVDDLLAERPAHAAADFVPLVDDGVRHRRVKRVHLHQSQFSDGRGRWRGSGREQGGGGAGWTMQS